MLVTRPSLRMLLKIDGIPILLFSLLSTAIYCLHHFADVNVEVPLSVVATLGTAVAILLGFKNNTAYDRWWEARKIWGGMVNQSRFLGSQLVAYVDKGATMNPEAHKQLLHQLVRRHLGYLNVLRLQLREAPTDSALEKWIVLEELEKLSNAKNKATQILTLQSHHYRELYEGKHIEQFRLFELMSNVRSFLNYRAKPSESKTLHC